jgi:hypothetical protein
MLDAVPVRNELGVGSDKICSDEIAQRDGGTRRLLRRDRLDRVRCRRWCRRRQCLRLARTLFAQTPAKLAERDQAAVTRLRAPEIPAVRLLAADVDGRPRWRLEDPPVHLELAPFDDRRRRLGAGVDRAQASAELQEPALDEI